MNKQALVEKIHNQLGGTKVQAEEVVNSVFDSMVGSLKSGEDVSIAGFGNFVVKDRAARTARNPRTGETVDVPASKAVKFKPAKALKDSVNQ